jgi:hypothetical protein
MQHGASGSRKKMRTARMNIEWMACVLQLLALEALPFPLSSLPKRTRISYFTLLATTTCAALRKESHMQIIKATRLDRKSGEAQWRYLCVDALS